MPTIRDHVKETLARTEPDDVTARADLQKVLVRTRRPRKAWLLAPAFAAAAIVVVWMLFPKKPAVVQAKHDGVHLYLRSAGEPESNAITLDLD